jgi:hypothetical protein
MGCAVKDPGRLAIPQAIREHRGHEVFRFIGSAPDSFMQDFVSSEYSSPGRRPR